MAQISQNFLSKAMAEIGCFSKDDVKENILIQH
jgi:hypothetical protein